MKTKAIIFDLDNTIYPVSSIGDKLFEPVFKLIEESGFSQGEMKVIKSEMMRKPYQFVASKHHFSKPLTEQGIEIMRELSYSDSIEPFPDYPLTKLLHHDRFLVTAGFCKMQESKIRQLGIKDDFKEIFIVDNTITDKNKKDVFVDIIQKYYFLPAELCIVGDDPDSEIKAALELGVRAILYDKANWFPDHKASPKISDYSKLKDIIDP